MRNLLIALIVALTITACGRQDENIIVDGKQWESYAEWQDSYLLMTCVPMSNGKTVSINCLPETKWKTVCFGTRIGSELPIIYPELDCHGDDYTQSVTYTIFFHVEDSTESESATVNFEQWDSVVINRSYLADFDFAGKIKELQ